MAHRQEMLHTPALYSIYSEIAKAIDCINILIFWQERTRKTLGKSFSVRV